MSTLPFETLASFFDTAEFAETASFYNWNGSGFDAPVSVLVIFDEESFTVDPYTGDPLKSRPEAIIRTSEASGAKHKDKIEIGGTAFEIVEADADGTGLTRLILTKIL